MHVAMDITFTAVVIIKIYFFIEITVSKNIISDSSCCNYRYNQLQMLL